MTESASHLEWKCCGQRLNDKRRSFLKDAIYHLNKAQTIVEQVNDQEDDVLSNVPDNLQASERYEKIEDAIDKLNDASEKIDEARDCIEEAMK